MGDDVIARSADDGDAIWMLGGVYTVMAAAGETDGKLTVMEMTIPPGAAPPPHTHPGGEAVYVLEGTITYHIGDDAIEGRAGSFFYIPEGTVEFFEPTGDSPARLLVIYIPGGMDQFFREAGETAPSHELPPPPDAPPDIERIVEIGRRFGMDIQTPA
jgi:quercetin dioxygenase-like cupin family protein